MKLSALEHQLLRELKPHPELWEHPQLCRDDASTAPRWQEIASKLGVDANKLKSDWCSFVRRAALLDFDLASHLRGDSQATHSAMAERVDVMGGDSQVPALRRPRLSDCDSEPGSGSGCASRLSAMSPLRRSDEEKAIEDVNFLEQLVHEEETLMRATVHDIKQAENTHLGDSDYNFLVSFLPTIKRMTPGQNVEFRAKMGALIYHVLNRQPHSVRPTARRRIHRQSFP